MEKFWVFLKVGESLEAFYEDMETPGGSLHIPDRQVEVADRNGISPGTLYELTTEEAREVAADERVAEIIPKSVAEKIQFVEQNAFVNRNFSKNSVLGKYFTRFDGTQGLMYSDETLANWGTLRHTEETNRADWTVDGTPDQSDTVKFSANGANVDVIVMEKEGVYELEEYSAQWVKHNWGQHFDEATSGSIGNWTYDYDELKSPTYNDEHYHPSVSASLIAGSWFGIADKCNLYSYSTIYVQDKLEDLGYTSGDGITSSSLFWNVVRTFHANKAVNPATGVKNPTIVNVSLGTLYYFDSTPTHGSFRGSVYADVTQTEADLKARGVSADHNENYTSTTNFYLNAPAGITNIDTAISEGIHVVSAAGNNNTYMDVSGGQDWDNYMVIPGLPDESWYRIYYHRGDMFTAGGAIDVGALAPYEESGEEKKAVFSNWGPGIDIYACGQNITSGHSGPFLNSGENYPFPYQKDQEYFDIMQANGAGTSYACPQVVAIGALYLQLYPHTTPAELKAWLQSQASTNQMYDPGGDFPLDTNDRLSLAGGDGGLVMRWINHKATEGNLAWNTYGARPTSGATYPRRKVRHMG